MLPDRATTRRVPRSLPALVAAAWTVALGALIPVAPAPAQDLTPAASFQIVHEDPGLSLHDEMYILPLTWADAYHGRQSEVVFQLSAKQALYGSRVYFAYRQISYWQAYYADGSAPFRETDYNPEFFYRVRPRPYAGGSAGADLGFAHESNGQSGSESRSWNHVYVAPHFQRDRLLLRLKLRLRIPEDEKETPTSARGDDNPDLTDFLGHADLNLYYRWSVSRQIHLLVRGNPATGRGFASLKLSRRLPREQDAWLVLTLSTGYGESLADYDRQVSRAGLGVMLTR